MGQDFKRLQKERVCFEVVVDAKCLLMCLMFCVVQLVDEEMFWVATEVCSETNMVKRVRIIKQFVKIASKPYIYVISCCCTVSFNSLRDFNF